MADFIQKTKRLVKLSSVIAQYGFDELFKRGDLEKYIPGNIKRKYSDKIDEINACTFYERIRMAIEEMGPVYVKFGQMLSNRKDILPEEILLQLQKLQDSVEIEEVDVRKKMNLELGIEVDDYFSEIEEEPMASASIGQVFRGKLKNGEKVVVKIQRENITFTENSQLINSIPDGFKPNDISLGIESALASNLTNGKQGATRMRVEKNSLNVWGTHTGSYNVLKGSLTYFTDN